MSDPFPSDAVARLIGDLAPLCISAADRHCLETLETHAKAIWRAVTIRKKMCDGLRLPPAARAYQYPARSSRKPPEPLKEIKRIDKFGRKVVDFEGSSLAWIHPTEQQLQTRQFLLLLRNLFQIFRELPEDLGPQLSRARGAECLEYLSDVFRLLQPAAESSAFMADLFSIAGASHSAGLKAGEAEELASDLAALRRVTRIVSTLAMQAETRRNRCDPRVKLLQISIAAAFERHFGTPQHSIAAKLTAVFLQAKPNREVSRYARRVGLNLAR